MVKQQVDFVHQMDKQNKYRETITVWVIDLSKNIYCLSKYFVVQNIITIVGVVI